MAATDPVHVGSDDDIQEFRSTLDSCDWLFDFFAAGFDYLSKRFVPDERDILQFDWEEQVDRVAAQKLVQRFVRDDGTIPDAAWHYLQVPSRNEEWTQRPFLIRLLALLTAIDMASAGFNYFLPGQELDTWNDVRQRLFRFGALNRRARGRVVLLPPRLSPDSANVWWRRAIDLNEWESQPLRGSHLYRWFVNLCRVPDIQDCLIEHKILAAEQDLTPDEWRYLRIAVVPLVERMEVNDGFARLLPGPLRMVGVDCNPPGFSVDIDEATSTVSQCEDLARRAESAIRALAERGVQIVIFPELVVPDPVLIRIKSTLRHLNRGGNATIQLVLAGTFLRKIQESAGEVPFNVAVVLNGQGEELWRQSKLHPYQMEYYEQLRYGLEVVFKSTHEGNRRKEVIECSPRKLVFCDSRVAGLRMTVIICEDACHSSPGLSAIRALRPNLAMSPVMAGALLSDRQFGKTAADLAREPGATTLVGNSGGLASSEWENRAAKGERLPFANAPLGIVALPLLNKTTHSPLVLMHETTRLSNDVQVAIFQCPTL